MREFWDDKARENAMYYVSSYLPYDEQDPEEFWKWGGILVDRFLDESGIEFTGQESMLEIGCGIGKMTRAFAGRFGSVAALDVSSEMVEQARVNAGNAGNVTFVVGNGADLQTFENDAFDFVFTYIVFQHIPDTAIVCNYIREVGRVLRPGGNFYFQVNNMPVGIRARLRPGRLRSAIRHLLGGKQSQAPEDSGPRGLDHRAWTGSRISVKQIEKTVGESNMQVLSLRGKGTQYLWVRAAKQ